MSQSCRYQLGKVYMRLPLLQNMIQEDKQHRMDSDNTIQPHKEDAPTQRFQLSQKMLRKSHLMI
jgi:hypothetical protein